MSLNTSSPPLPSVSQYIREKTNEQTGIIKQSISDTKNKLYDTAASSYKTIYAKYDSYSIKNAICSVDNRESEKKRNKWSKIILTVLIIFIILLIFSIGFYIRQNNSNSKYDPIYGIVFGVLGILVCIVGHYYNTKTYIDNSKYDDDDSDIESLKNNKKEIRTILNEISSLQKEISTLQRKLSYEKIKEKSKQIIQDYKKRSNLNNNSKVQPSLLRQNAQSNLSESEIPEEDENNFKGKEENEQLTVITETITNKHQQIKDLTVSLSGLKKEYEELKQASDAYNELQNSDNELYNNINPYLSDIISTQPDSTNILVYNKTVSNFLNNIINNLETHILSNNNFLQICNNNFSKFNDLEKINFSNKNVDINKDRLNFIDIKKDIEEFIKPENKEIDENGIDFLIKGYIDIFSKYEFILRNNKIIQAEILNIYLDYLFNVYDYPKDNYDSIINQNHMNNPYI